MPGRWYGRAARTVPVVSALLALASVSACGTLPERRDEVSAAVSRFEEALGAGRYAELCADLAPGTRDELEQSAKSACDRAIGEEDLSPAGAPRQVDVYGDQARVVLDRDTVFLAHFPTGWTVGAPHDATGVEG